MNEKVAVLAAYFMTRFNSNLGFDTQTEAFSKIESETGIPANTVRREMRDVFDYWFPHREGWDLNKVPGSDFWVEHHLQEIYDKGNNLSMTDLKEVLVLLGIWA